MRFCLNAIHLGVRILALFLMGCSNQVSTEPVSRKDAVTNNQDQDPASVDVRMPTLEAPQINTVQDNASTASTNALDTSTLTQVTVSGEFAPPSTVEESPAAHEDVGYEGLSRSINSIEQLAQPLLLNPNGRLSPDVATQLVNQSRTYMKELQKAGSVEKELRHELWDRAIDINAALTELKDSPPAPRYGQLRAILSEQIEQTQGQLLSGSTSR